MSTNTPKTDAEEYDTGLRDGQGPPKDMVVSADFARTLERDLAAARAEIERLAAFKAFVHEFLDRNGVPTDPPGKMRDEGCRVGQRLKYLADERDAARARVAELEAGLREAIEALDDAARLIGFENRNPKLQVRAIAKASAILSPEPKP